MVNKLQDSFFKLFDLFSGMIDNSFEGMRTSSFGKPAGHSQTGIHSITPVSSFNGMVWSSPMH